jgi:hypothetical protein
MRSPNFQLGSEQQNQSCSYHRVQSCSYHRVQSVRLRKRSRSKHRMHLSCVFWLTFSSHFLLCFLLTHWGMNYDYPDFLLCYNINKVGSGFPDKFKAGVRETRLSLKTNCRTSHRLNRATVWEGERYEQRHRRPSLVVLLQLPVTFTVLLQWFWIWKRKPTSSR